MRRREFLRTSFAGSTALAIPASIRGSSAALADARSKPHLRLSCNLYSFNAPLRSGAMSLEEVFEFCADVGFDAVDPTGYYFPGYPEPPSNEYVHAIKRHAFLLGLDISGTGVRNDFTVADPAMVAADITLVERWIDTAAELGAPCIRVFAGRAEPEGAERPSVLDRVVEAVRACCELGSRRGVMIALQNHAHFIKTPDQVLEILDAVDSDWLGVNLDVGSFRGVDAYEAIARIAPHAITWQIKENLTDRNRELKTDLKRLVEVIRASNFRGYLPIETLDDTPTESIPRFYAEVSEALAG